MRDIYVTVMFDWNCYALSATIPFSIFNIEVVLRVHQVLLFNMIHCSFVVVTTWIVMADDNFQYGNGRLIICWLSGA